MPVFGALALVCGLSAFFTWRWMHEPDFSAEVSTGLQNASMGLIGVKPPPPLQGPLKNRKVWRMVAAIGLLCVPQFAVLSYATVFMHDHGHLGLAARLGPGRCVLRPPTWPACPAGTSPPCTTCSARWLAHSRLSTPLRCDVHTPDGPGAFTAQDDAAIHSDSASALLGFALGGCGVALLPQWQVEGAVRAGRLRRLLPDVVFPQQGVYAVYPNTRHIAEKVRAFIDFLRAFVGTSD